MKIDEPNVEDVKLCGWCGIPLGSANLVSESVCVRCAEFLVNTGLSNEEIFSDKDNEEDSSLSVPNKEDNQ